jgi:hypothetical protein
MKSLRVILCDSKKIVYSNQDNHEKIIDFQVTNQSIEFNQLGLFQFWIRDDFCCPVQYRIVSDINENDFKPNGRPVLAIIKTLNGRDFIRVPPPELLVAIRDDAGVTLAEKYQQYLQNLQNLQKEMARLSLVQR